MRALGFSRYLSLSLSGAFLASLNAGHPPRFDHREYNALGVCSASTAAPSDDRENFTARERGSERIPVTLHEKIE